jgi:hypothetical protein
MKVTLEQTTKAQRVSTLSLTSALDGSGWPKPHPGRFTPEKDPVPIYWAGWASGPVWTGAENLTSTGIRFPDRPACSESLYRLYFFCAVALRLIPGHDLPLTGIHDHTHSDTLHSIGLLWRLIGPTQRPLPDTTQHSQEKHSFPLQDSNPQSQQESGRRPTP